MSRPAVYWLTTRPSDQMIGDDCGWLQAEVHGVELGRPLDPRKQTRPWRPVFVATRMPLDDGDDAAPHRWDRRVGAWAGRDRPFGDGDTPHPGAVIRPPWTPHGAVGGRWNGTHAHAMGPDAAAEPDNVRTPSIARVFEKTEA